MPRPGRGRQSLGRGEEAERLRADIEALRVELEAQRNRNEALGVDSVQLAADLEAQRAAAAQREQQLTEER
jgi:hypothetical protein